MTHSVTKSLRTGLPPPQVVLLPDAMFFVRAVAVAAGSTLADVTAQVELALETLSPFPPTQLYYGFFWPPGATRVLIFAAYRRRFTAEQTEAWESSELVLPTFAAMLGGNIQPDTTLIIPSEEGLTAVYWDTGPVPARVTFRALPADATEADRAAAREELLNAGARKRNIVLANPPAVETSRSDREISFHADGYPSHLSVAQAGPLDVRDKVSLAALRRTRARDLGLWRGLVALVVTLAILALGELTLVGAGLWNRTRLTKINALRPVVEKIETAQALTTRINEFSTKRLLPFEMIALASEKKPESVTFVRTSTSGLYQLIIEATTRDPGGVSAYKTALSASPAIEKVEIPEQRTRDNVVNFTLTVAFRPDALKPVATTP